ncbi:hypothetical protein scyTo_0022149 [Scyliorhinus torazame]|uniref:Uncharacterized protein n=1 Tax=Scyliorhinus torazame TaxID=75743 RepID=A0A401Q788_SCYTO|nr:hypothetical protein [Scyliorhinus torazame]
MLHCIFLPAPVCVWRQSYLFLTFPAEQSNEFSLPSDCVEPSGPIPGLPRKHPATAEDKSSRDCETEAFQVYH